MTLEQFRDTTQLLNQTEIEKVRLLTFYYHKTAGQTDFTLDDVAAWFEKLNLPTPNKSRLKKNLKRSKQFVKGIGKETFRLHALDLDELQSSIPGIHRKSEDVVSSDTVMPTSLYANTRGFIESLAKQINASFEYNIYDGCAVLMRRLLEVLLILSYENLNIEDQIKEGGGKYQPLKYILNNAETNQTLKLSVDSKDTMDSFRTLGNFSAHKIYFNCRRTELDRVLVHYRATIEELLYKSGVRK